MRVLAVSFVCVWSIGLKSLLDGLQLTTKIIWSDRPPAYSGRSASMLLGITPFIIFLGKCRFL